MPELPEVETAMRGIEPALLGARLTRVTAFRPDLRWPIPPDLAQRLTGASVVAVGRRAKYGLIGTDRGDTLILHLGMSGALRLNPAERRPHDHVVFETAANAVHFHDPRRFGSLHLADTATHAAHPLLAGLGPEPLSAAFDGAHLARAAAGRATSVKALLLDQRTVAGLGNIYVAEALHRAGIAPTRAAGRVSARRLVLLADAVKAVLGDAIAAGGSSLRDHAQASGESGYFQHAHRVYGREGAACPTCASPVKRMVQSGRSTFHCPRCQR